MKQKIYNYCLFSLIAALTLPVNADSSYDSNFTLSGYGTIAYTFDNQDDLAFVRELTAPAEYGQVNNPKMKTRSGVRIIKNGGWHLSYFGDERFIQNKLMNFSHQEYNKPHITDLNEIKRCVEERKDICHRRGVEFIHVPIDKNTFLPVNYGILLKNRCV